MSQCKRINVPQRSRLQMTCRISHFKKMRRARAVALLVTVVCSRASVGAIPGADPTGNHDATRAIQAAIDATPAGGLVQFEPGRYRMSGLVELRHGVRIDFTGATITFDSGFTNKGFQVQSSIRADVIEFANGVFAGDGTEIANQGPVVSSFSGCRIGRFVIRDCTFRDLTYGCNINCAQGGWIRQAVLQDCLFENMVGSDPERGKGAAISLNPKEFCSGRSSGNVFINCGRHSLYVSTGGRFLSDGDTFYRNNETGTTTYPLAAVSLARGSHMRVTNGYFEGCRDGISLTSSDPEADLHDVAISNCTFFRNLRYDVVLNSDNPEAHGRYHNVRVTNTQHHLQHPRSAAFSVLSFDRMRISNVTIEDLRPQEARAVWIWGQGESRDLELRRLSIWTNHTREKMIWIRPGVESHVRLDQAR